MSKHTTSRRKTIVDIQNLKDNDTPVVVLTAYTAPMAQLIDPHADILLVGDSLGMVLYGMESTLPVTLDMMIAHGKAVVKASSAGLVVVDMPFGSYQGSYEAAFNACARVIKETGCQAVKIEGGAEMADTIAFLTSRAIPVMGHVALMPQHVNSMGGYRYRGRTPKERKQIMEDAVAVQEAGAFAVVLEGVEESLARLIAEKLSIVTIGIGASPACDGQVLVAEDMLGLNASVPSFVKKYADLQTIVTQAVSAYAAEVRGHKFPTLEHCFTKK
ncbi:MAG TPA: 3-methyl-2-oxobutanoate hydroxymethyltransferase [Rickettsiales bacterium]|nr:3-methyl-2-oxobutanoate hydroxymethyltransferase [Rickettsiales bacterium]